MMVRTLLPRPRFAAIVGIVVPVAFLAVAPGMAVAGPGRYDPATRGFHLSYAYADLPGGIGSSPGTPQQATEDQDARVRALIADVSRVLHVATDGRARIASFERVNRSDAADIIIALRGHPGRAAWANVGALGARGQMAFYYEYLLPQLRPDVALTAAHELCHYLFALPDEYPPQGSCCPAGNRGPGCLMDNYWSQGGRGWYQRLCTDSDHNPRIPVTYNGRSYPSCRALVDTFFARYNVPVAPGPIDSDPIPAGHRIGTDNSAQQADALVLARQLAALQETLRRARATVALAQRYGVTFTPQQQQAHVRTVLAATLAEQGLSVSATDLDRAALRLAAAVSGPGQAPSRSPSPSRPPTPFEALADLAASESHPLSGPNPSASGHVGSAPAALASLAPEPATPALPRRTCVVAPPPADPALDRLAGFDPAPARYDALVGDAVETFRGLLASIPHEGDPAPRVVDLAACLDAAPTFAAREAAAESLLDNVLSRPARRQLDGVVLIVPPGGLPASLGARLESLHDRLAAQVGMRLDLVQVGSAPIPVALRDLVTRSGGATLTLADVHEIGAVAQRLRNGHSAAASWITPPRTFQWPSVPQNEPTATIRAFSGEARTSSNPLVFAPSPAGAGEARPPDRPARPPPRAGPPRRLR